MTVSLNYSVTVGGLGMNISQNVNRTANGSDVRTIPLAAANAGTLSTRTDDATGVATVGTGHGITTDDTIDVYWAGGMRYGCTVTAVTSTTISFDGGSGADLPSATTVINVSAQVEVEITISEANYQFLAICMQFANSLITDDSHVDLQESGGTSVYATALGPNEPLVVDIQGGASSPLADDIGKIMASNGSSIGAATLQVMVLTN